MPKSFPDTPAPTVMMSRIVSRKRTGNDLVKMVDQQTLFHLKPKENRIPKRNAIFVYNRRSIVTVSTLIAECDLFYLVH